MPYNTESKPIVLARPAQNSGHQRYPPPPARGSLAGPEQAVHHWLSKGKAVPFSQVTPCRHTVTLRQIQGGSTPPPHPSVWALHQH